MERRRTSIGSYSDLVDTLSIQQLSDLWHLYVALQATTPDVSTGKEFFRKWTKVVGENVAKLEIIKLVTRHDTSVESHGELE